MKVAFVFSTADKQIKQYEFTRLDYYYVYNYNETDSSTLFKMLDTLTIDSMYNGHLIYFYKYDSNMPDTISLAKK